MRFLDAFNQTEAGRQQGGKGTGLGLALVRQIVKLSGGRLGVHSKVGQGSTFWVELRVSPFLSFLLASLVTVLQALGVGTSALSILPKPQLDSLNSQRGVPSPPPPPPPDVEAQVNGQSGTVLEQMTSPDGLVQLMPRKRKAGEHHMGCKGPGLFAPGAGVPMVEKDDEDGVSQPGTPSGPSPAWVVDPSPTPTPVPGTPATPSQEQGCQLGHLEQTREVESSTLVTRPTHVDLPPPPKLKAPPVPQKPPGPSPSPLPQIDVMPGLPVLVVDDDKVTRMLFQRMLGRLKCSVTTAVNGYEALQLITGDQNVSQTPAEEDHEYPFSYGDSHASAMEKEVVEEEKKESKFAIVFLDNQMPVMSGVEMVRKLRKLGRKDLVVGVTGEFSPFPLSPFVYDAQWVNVGGDLITRGFCRECAFA